MSKNKLLILVTGSKRRKHKPIINAVGGSLKKKKEKNVNGRTIISLDVNSRQQPHTLSPTSLLTEAREGVLSHHY